MFTAPNKYDLPSWQNFKKDLAEGQQELFVAFLSNQNTDDKSPKAQRFILLENSFQKDAYIKARLKDDHLFLPLIDQTGDFEDWADAVITAPLGAARSQIQQIINQFAQRRAKLPEWILKTSDQDMRLLAWFYVSGQALPPAYEPNKPEMVSYGLAAPLPNLQQSAERLAEQGYLKRHFFDRLHYCKSCGSSRLNAREECLSCSSANIEEQALFHHFRCAYQGPASDFKTINSRLECPKCKTELKHYGSDHERSGFIIQCHDCGDGHSGVGVGFICADCGAKEDGETMPTKAYYSYELSNQGEEFLTRASDHKFNLSQNLNTAGIPLQLALKIQALILKGEDHFTLAALSYKNERQVIYQSGVDHFEKLRSHIIHNLKNLISNYGHVEQGKAEDFILLEQVSKQELEGEKDFLIAQAKKELETDLNIEIHLFDKGDFNGL